MATTGAHSVGGQKGRGQNRDDKVGMTPAQWYCLLAGLGLLLAGIFGFLADSTFDTGGTVDPNAGGNADGQLQGDSFLGFEVNGWHNIVHLLSGIVLLAAFRKNNIARKVALAFGIVYGLVTLIGLIDGNDILGLLPVNPADNILHLVLSALGIITALLSRDRDHHDRNLHTTAPAQTTGRRVDTSDVVRGNDGDRGGRFERGQELDPRDMNPGDRGAEPTTDRRTL
jgi:hypothetical protein